jgi:hypothetical protein
MKKVHYVCFEYAKLSWLFHLKKFKISVYGDDDEWVKKLIMIELQDDQLLKCFDF